MLNHQQPFPANTQQYYPNMQPQQQMQNGGFISVPSIDAAQRYPVAPGNSVTFKIENAPVVCEKTQGFSVLEAPTFKVFDLVEHKLTPSVTEPAPEQNNYATRTEIDALNEHILTLEGQLSELRDKLSDKKQTARKKGENENE
jgi:hypothetical protein